MSQTNSCASVHIVMQSVELLVVVVCFVVVVFSLLFFCVKCVFRALTLFAVQTYNLSL